MKFLKLFAVSLVLSAGAAHADDTVASKDAQKWLVFFDKLVDTVVADKDACPKMGTDLNAVIDANKELMEKAKAAAAAGKKLPPDAQKHMEQSAQKMMPGLMNCGSDAKVKAAIDRLRGFGPPPQHH